MQYTYHYTSPLGGITLAGNENVLTGLWFDGQKNFGSTLGKGCKQGELPVFEQTKRWLDLYFAGKAPGFIPPLFFEATSFRRTIWKILLTIPYGKTMTYKEIAEQAAEREGLSRISARAVGGAIGHNPISLIVPCHRVLGTNGSLTGYAGGIERKQKLLAVERAAEAF